MSGRISNSLPGRLVRRYPDAPWVLALLILAASFVAPAVKDGFAFGGYDFDLSLTSLTQGAIPVVHSPFNGDAISQMVSWNALDWTMVHHGQFPLWNPYSVLGMPQFLNFESSVLSLPDLLSYLAPRTEAFLVVVVAKLALAGVGTYLCCRVLGTRRSAAFFGGATFMLSGAFASWVTWPLTDVACWSGWIAAFAILAWRGVHPVRDVTLLAVSVAFSIYGGFPEANVMYAILAITFAVVFCVIALVRRIRLRGAGALRVLAGGVAGTMLAAPLWLPGLTVISLAHRTQEGHYVGLPTRALPGLFSQGYFGLPYGAYHSTFMLTRWNYYETVAYVGVLALVLALVAIGVGWRRPVVIGIVVALVIALGFTYEPVMHHPLQSLTYRSSQLTTIRFERMRIFTGFLIAVLAAIGLDAVASRWREIFVRRVFLGAATVIAAVVALAGLISLHDHLVDVVHRERFLALVWPVVLAGTTFCVAAALVWRATARAVTATVAAAVVAQVAFLFTAGVGIPSYAKVPYPVTPAVATLQSVVGSSLVGLDGGNTSDVRAFTHIGFYPNVNIGYGIHLFAVHDPLVPSAYFLSWPDQAAAPNKFGPGLFVPDVNSAALARRYGIHYVLTAPGLDPPAGMRLVTTIAGERLYAVPGAARFAILGGTGSEVRGVRTNGNGAYAFTVAAGAHPRTLVLRITNLPGWHVTVNGAPVAVHPYDHVMLSVTVPASGGTVHAVYAPRRLGEGIALAALAAAALVGVGGALALRRRHREDAAVV